MKNKKKHLPKLLLLIVIATICTFAIFNGVNTVSANNNRSYFISKYNILININKDGSADIEEHITYKFTGKFNGVILDIDLSGTGGMREPQVFINRKEGQIEAKKSNSESPGTYIYASSNNYSNFKIFEPSSNENKTFLFKYTLIDAVTRYKDIAEFNRKMIGTQWDVPINDIYIKVTIPKGATEEDVRVFGHGPLTGESEIIDSENVEFKVPEISAGTFVETRVMFPNKLVPDAKNFISKNALEDILAHEKKLAEEANLEREKARDYVRQLEEERLKQYRIGSTIFSLLLPLWLILIVYIYIKYDKEFKHSFFGRYYRELPGEYTPAEVSVLMSMGKVYPRDVMATLMDLVRKRYLLLEQVSIDRKTLFRTKNITDYMISLNNEKPLEGLKSHESFLINWFINDIGNGHDVLLDDIKGYSKSSNNALDFKASYDLWCEKAKTAAQKNNFFDKSANKGRIIGMLSSLLFIAAGIILPIMLHTNFGVILFLLGILMFIFSVRIKKRSIYGNEQYAMWKAFKRFLKDFSRLKEAEVSSIILWEHYLVYAISLGIAREVIKQLPLVLQEDDLKNPGLTFLYGMSYGHFNNFERSFNNTIRTVENAIATASTIAASKNSSASGGGGGFSGGSSGGGGGGSGGGAF